jgi:hypothetical protein
MRKMTKYFAVMIFATQVFATNAQSQEKTEPQFTLTILSELHGEFGPALNMIEVKETNISNEVIYDPGCVQTRGWMTVTVFYNGLPLEEKDVKARHRREKERREYCTSGRGVNGIKPGEYLDYVVSVADIYDVSKPGTYGITVSMESDPDHPEKSVTVKSNTLTVVVPEPGASAPQ